MGFMQHISSSGGISTWQDAAEFLLLGASSLQICTAVLRHGIGMVEGLPKVIMNKCIGCGICRAMCSFEAISLVRPVGGGQDYSERVRVCF